MKLSRSRWIAWGAAALIAAVGWGCLGFVVEGIVGLFGLAFMSAAVIAGIASLAND
jgi:hypothetical protein